MRTDELHVGMRVYVTTHWRFGTITEIYEKDGRTRAWVDYDVDDYEWWQAHFSGDEEPPGAADVPIEDIMPPT